MFLQGIFTNGHTMFIGFLAAKYMLAAKASRVIRPADCPLLSVMVALTFSVLSLMPLTVANLTLELDPVSVPAFFMHSPD